MGVTELVSQQSRLAAHTRLLQFASQALPTGAYAYSSGLESMLSLGWLSGVEQCREYLLSLMDSSLRLLELPLFLQMFDGIHQGDTGKARRASMFLLASRETGELQAQEEQMARALCRVLADLRPEEYERIEPPTTYSHALAHAAHWFGINREEACVLFAYSWLEQQVSALCRLIPLGPIAGQRLLDATLETVPRVIEGAASVDPLDIGSGAPALAVASSLHEHQYCRIFRS